MSRPNIQARRRLMRAIAGTIERRGLVQREAAELFRTTQPRISEIVRGKIEEVSLDALVNMLAAAGMEVPLLRPARRPEPHPPDDDAVVRAYAEHVDRTQIREALRRTPTERMRALGELQALADEAARAGRRRRTAR